MADPDAHFMNVALDCAAAGRGAVEPNPMVGAVIVRDGVELGRGWHERFGGLHAERNALAAAGDDLRGATMYVTLEPCCHQGKTPPCTGAILAAGIARVVVAMTDPDENVAGRGIEILRGAGVQVDVGVCGERAAELLGAYCKLRTRGRPWVMCKWAQTSDGYLALPPGSGRWVSGDESRARVHEIRSWCDGILVGIGTVLADDPLLTDRSEIPNRGRQLTRVVLDSHLRIPAGSQLVATADRTPVLVATTATADPQTADALRSAGVELIELPAAGAGLDLEALLDELGRRQWTYLLVEGGPKVLGSFIYSHLADELLVFVSPRTARPSGDPLAAFDIAELAKRLELGAPTETPSGRDVLLRYLP